MARGDKSAEERVRRVGLAQEFWVKLTRHEKWMVLQFNNFNQLSIRGSATKQHPGFFELRFVAIVKFIAVPMPFVDQEIGRAHV